MFGKEKCGCALFVSRRSPAFFAPSNTQQSRKEAKEAGACVSLGLAAVIGDAMLVVCSISYHALTNQNVELKIS